MKLPASVLGMLRLGLGASAIVLPGCDAVEAAQAEAQAAFAAEAEAGSEQASDGAAAEPTGAAELERSFAPKSEPAPLVAEVSKGLGSDVASAIERARTEQPALDGPAFAEDPTVVVPFSEDPSRVEPIRPRAKTPAPIVRSRVKPRRVTAVAPVAPIMHPVAPVIAEPPRGWDSCPACGRG